MIVQVSSGQGPAECDLAVWKLFEALEKEFGPLKVLDCHEAKGCHGDARQTERTGASLCEKRYNSITFATEEDLTFLEGSVQWICKSPIRKEHKRKNWFIDVSIIPEADQICSEKEFRFERFRSGGAGGQLVNKTESGVRLVHIPTGLSVVCTSERSQYQNKKGAMAQMSVKLALLEKQSLDQQKNAAWREHTKLVRGNPVRVYVGEEFKERRG